MNKSRRLGIAFIFLFLFVLISASILLLPYTTSYGTTEAANAELTFGCDSKGSSVAGAFTETGGIIYISINYTKASNQHFSFKYETVSGIPIEGIDYRVDADETTKKNAKTTANAIPNVDYTPISGVRSIDVNTISGVIVFSVKINVNTPKPAFVLNPSNDANTKYTRAFAIRIYDVQGATITMPQAIKNSGAGNYRMCRINGDYTTTFIPNYNGKGDTSNTIPAITEYTQNNHFYYSGNGYIDGGHNYTTSFSKYNSSTTDNYVRYFINKNFAKAYGVFYVKRLNNADGSPVSFTNHRIIMGNQTYIDNYNNGNFPYNDSNGSGTMVWLDFEQGYWSPGKNLTPKAWRINCYDKKSPYDDDGDLWDIENQAYNANWIKYYYHEQKGEWFADKGSLVEVPVFEIPVINNSINYAMFVRNRNDEYDINCTDIDTYLFLVDHSGPVLQSTYLDDGNLAQTGKIQIYFRFNEPIYAKSTGKSGAIKFNNGGTPYNLTYVGGNYTDTLIYEINLNDNRIRGNITTAQVQLPNDNIYDLGVNLSSQGYYKNNVMLNSNKDSEASLLNGAIEYRVPELNAEITSSPKPENSYNFYLSAGNAIEGRGITRGTVYFSWDQNESWTTEQKEDENSYSNSHILQDYEGGSFPVGITSEYEEDRVTLIRNGPFYLHVCAISAYNLKKVATFGPYNIDGDAPSAIQTKPEAALDTLTKKTFKFEIKDMPDASGTIRSGINKITLVYEYTQNGEDNRRTQLIFDNGDKVAKYNSVLQIDGNNYRYTCNIDTNNPYPQLDTTLIDIMSTTERVRLNVYVEVEDKAGNKTTSNTLMHVFDTRTKIDTTYTVPASYSEINDITLPYGKAYDIINYSGEGAITVNLPSSEEGIVDGVDVIFYVAVNDDIENAYQADPSTPLKVEISDLEPGYYIFLPYVVDSSAGTPENKVGDEFYIYLTNGKEDPTTNYLASSNRLVLANSVYQLTETYFYYLDSSNQKVAQPYGSVLEEGTNKFVGGSTTPVFSSQTVAKQYLRFMEYQDMTLILVNESIASMLNSSSGSTLYVKADGETTVAAEGQLWIKYKRTTWTSTSNTYGWAYYYYASSGTVAGGININSLSANLANAINNVVNKIAYNGAIKYLINGSNISSITGAPYINPNQYHVDPEIAMQTKNGILFTGASVTFAGDTNLYQNKVVESNVVYPLATNMLVTFSQETFLYFRYLESSDWYPITGKTGDLLYKLLNVQTGAYMIREYNKDGVNEFGVYIDRNIPRLRLTINNIERTLEGDALSWSGTECTLLELMGEIDPYSYVAIFNYPSGTLRTVLYAGDVPNYSLAIGNYYLQVGDRSGNAVVYTLLMSQTPLEVNIVESETYGGVVITTRNRAENEIYSFTIYLNDVIIASSFQEQYSFKTPGVYRVVVQDIYGDVVDMQLVFEYHTPNTLWYYQNSRGSYSAYDENNIVSMIMEKDNSNSSKWNIYTATLLRVTFEAKYNDSDIKFEITGLTQSDYMYNKSSFTLTINTLKRWSIRLWFEDYPDNDVTYNILIDTAAPMVSGEFIGVSYSEIVADLTGFNPGDTYIPETLKVNEQSAGTKGIINGTIMDGNYIKLFLEDESGIKSCVVEKDGKNINVDYSSNVLSLNGYGLYTVVTIDKLGNTGVFRFLNIKGALTKATLDNKIDVPVNMLTHGNTSYDINPQHDGTLRLKVESDVGTNVYLTLVYENGIVTSYIYVVAIEEIDDGSIVSQIKVVNRVDYGITYNKNAETTRLNRWYPFIDNDTFTIQAMFLDDETIKYDVVLKQGSIKIEARFDKSETKLPDYYTIELSKELSSVDFYSHGELITVIEGAALVYIADEFTVGAITNPKIVLIEVAYAETTEFTTYLPIYTTELGLSSWAGDKDGFYSIKVTNIYGNIKTYLISKTDSFNVTLTTIYQDGTRKSVSHNRKDDNGDPIPVYANKEILVTAYSDSIRIFIYNEYTGKYDIEIPESEIIVEEHVCKYTFADIGTFKIEIINSNGLFKEYVLIIGTEEDFEFNDTWITGYNENALMKDSGYTNQRLNIVPVDRVAFIMIHYGQSETIVYDLIADTQINNIEALMGCVGISGDGVYTIEFRNIYGDVTLKEIHYSSTPTLKLTRTTMASLGVEEYSIDKAITEGFYSSNALMFTTTSILYRFTINGELVSLESTKTLMFNNASGNGSFEYAITYLDEYGFSYSFKAILYRRDVNIDTSSMHMVEITSNLYTRDDISITFENEFTANVMINGEEAIDYVSGKKFRKDGIYRFQVVDIAGNQALFTISHKSVNKYSFISSANDTPIINGGVVNNTSVVYTPNIGETAQIQTVLRDGVEQKDYTSRQFNKTGHWEVIITDSIGNTGYFEFYIVNNPLAIFNYKAPNQYSISEVWYTYETGQRTLEPQLSTEEISLTKNGAYAVVLTNNIDNTAINFTVTIDNTPPAIALNGVEDGGVTPKDVSFSGLKNGDIIRIYKDGQLISVEEISATLTSPVISDGGDYRVVITNTAGVSREFTFTRKKVANVATSIFVIILAGAIVAGIIIGIFLRNRSKIDA